jgi:hypothetical protein
MAKGDYIIFKKPIKEVGSMRSYIVEGFLVVFLGAASLSYSAESPSMPPILPHVKIISPAADIPEDVRNFSGEFQGKWFIRRIEPSISGEIYGRLYVNFSLHVVNIRRVKGDIFRAKIIYAWGSNEQLGRTGGFREHDATIENKESSVSLCFDWENGKRWVFFFENGKLQGKVLMPGMNIVALETKKIR